MKQIASIILLLVSITAIAQQPAWRDTLDAAIKTDTRRQEESLGRIHTGIESIRRVVSPVGEGDPIRWIQGLPGVTTGADGTTAMYVRGGSSGNTLFSLDGVPVYGYSHILGLTNLVPTAVIERSEFGKGGFDGAESNFTASHLRVITKQPSPTHKINASLNNYLLSSGVEGPIGEKMGYIVSARISPLALEYRAIKGMLPGLLGGLNDFSASVGDVYAKFNVDINDKNTLTTSFLGGLDHYGFGLAKDSHEAMGWHNMLGIVQYQHRRDRYKLEVTASANNYGTSQEQRKIYHKRNDLSLCSNMTEYSLQVRNHHLTNGCFEFDEGVIIRFAQFAPGQIGEVVKSSNIVLSSIWFQTEYRIPNRLTLKASVRGNVYHGLDSLASEATFSNKGWRIDPELSAVAKLDITPHLAFETTYDRLLQYYHILEGLPVGWSLDLMVPTTKNVSPEMAEQVCAGITGRFGNHSWSLGGYYKLMKDLVIYKYSQSLFSGALAAWEDHVELGDGRSYGLEALYEYQHQDRYARVSYTLSKTTRVNFPSFYDGQPFHARFDRLHMLNATVQWKGFTVTVIYQSGNWENGEAVTYDMPYMEELFSAKYFSGINNFHMPSVFRLDLGWQKTFKSDRAEHSVNVGVCNATNHFNPFMLYFDTVTESWKEIALMPILPNFSWRVTF